MPVPLRDSLQKGLVPQTLTCKRLPSLSSLKQECSGVSLSEILNSVGLERNLGNLYFSNKCPRSSWDEWSCPPGSYFISISTVSSILLILQESLCCSMLPEVLLSNSHQRQFGRYWGVSVAETAVLCLVRASSQNVPQQAWMCLLPEPVGQVIGQIWKGVILGRTRGRGLSSELEFLPEESQAFDRDIL